MIDSQTYSNRKRKSAENENNLTYHAGMTLRPFPVTGIGGLARALISDEWRLSELRGVLTQMAG